MDRDRVARNLAAVENHFHGEALNEVEAALETFTDDVVWEAPAPNGLHRSFSGKAAAAENYRDLFGSMRNVKFQFLQRFATEGDRVRHGTPGVTPLGSRGRSEDGGRNAHESPSPRAR